MYNTFHKRFSDAPPIKVNMEFQFLTLVVILLIIRALK